MTNIFVCEAAVSNIERTLTSYLFSVYFDLATFRSYIKCLKNKFEHGHF